ncbi:hypothetical protein ACFOZ5_02535 [Marinobacter lacisalsi]|uniref:Uncharacterized protein n=1 Tax=Marinobacter lacisalsi TaxID=475979 RepID=A0ABV8QD98_9GAMM
MGILKEKGFDLEIVKGDVVSSSLRVETNVSGKIHVSGSDSTQVNGTTYGVGTTSGGGEIKTEHVRIQDLYLKIGENKERWRRLGRALAKTGTAKTGTDTLKRSLVILALYQAPAALKRSIGGAYR